MDHSAHNKIVSFIWSNADYCLGDVYEWARSGSVMDDNDEVYV